MLIRRHNFVPSDLQSMICIVFVRLSVVNTDDTRNAGRGFRRLLQFEFRAIEKTLAAPHLNENDFQCH
jgi:hypothetical protein